METQTEDGKANLKDFVQSRLHAIDADQLIPDADRLLDEAGRMQRPPHRKPVIAIISRPGENVIGEISIRYAQASEPLVSRLREVGATPIIVPETNHLEDIPLLFGPTSMFDGIIVPGTDWSDLAPEWYGEQNTGASEKADRDLDRFDMAVILWCTLVQPRPFLSMCLGFQAWNVVMGGSLYQDLVKQRGAQTLTLDHSRWMHGPEAEHQVIIDGNSRLYHALGRMRQIQTNTLHHQGVQVVAPGLTAVALSSPDWVVEALEFDPKWMKLMGVRRQFALGTQFHPELAVTDHESSTALSEIIPSFVQAAKKRH